MHDAGMWNADCDVTGNTGSATKGFIVANVTKTTARRFQPVPKPLRQISNQSKVGCSCRNEESNQLSDHLSQLESQLDLGALER